jgi:prepilin-type N-terminal cleavage/methylation domain-containing protein
MPSRLRLPDRRRGGFTLTELLVVVSIMALLTTVGLPSLGGINSSGKMTQAVAELSGLLDQAREYAVAQNTYVWVAFNTDSTTPNQDQITVAVIASQDGTDPSNADPNPPADGSHDYGTVPTQPLVLLGKVRSFSRVQLMDAGTFTSTQIAALGDLPSASSDNRISQKATFRVRLPGATTTTVFGQSIAFLPTGEARNGTAPIDLLEFGLQADSSKTAALGGNAAVVRVMGLTGQTTVYRR